MKSEEHLEKKTGQEQVRLFKLVNDDNGTFCGEKIIKMSLYLDLMNSRLRYTNFIIKMIHSNFHEMKPTFFSKFISFSVLKLIKIVSAV